MNLFLFIPDKLTNFLKISFSIFNTIIGIIEYSSDTDRNEKIIYRYKAILQILLIRLKFH